MSKIHSMPPDTNEKEKIIGGIFTIQQGIWIALGFILAGIIAMMFYRFIGGLVIILCIPCIVFGFVFAIKTVGDLSLPKYLLLKRKFKNKLKFYINDGKQSSFDFSDKK